MKNRFAVAALLAVVLIAGVSAARRGGVNGPSRVPGFRVQGPANAPVVITEYSDFQCPGCAKAHVLVKELMARHEGRVVLVFRHHPLAMHPWALMAARAAEAAGAQGKFWEYHDRLFDRQDEWAKAPDPQAVFQQYAKEVGLNPARFTADLTDGKWAATLQRDADDAKEQNVSATPTFFISGKRVVGSAQLAEFGDRYVEMGSFK